MIRLYELEKFVEILLDQNLKDFNVEFFGFDKIQIGQNRLDQFFFLFMRVSLEVAIFFNLGIDDNLLIFLIKYFEFLRIN